jgi:hypothetical protein
LGSGGGIMREVNLIKDLNIEKHILYDGQNDLYYRNYQNISPVYGVDRCSFIDYKTQRRVVPIINFVQCYVDDFTNIDFEGNPVVRREETFIAITDNVEGCLGKILKNLDDKIKHSEKEQARLSKNYLEMVDSFIYASKKLEAIVKLSFWQRLKFLFIGESYVTTE